MWLKDWQLHVSWCSVHKTSIEFVLTQIAENYINVLFYQLSTILNYYCQMLPFYIHTALIFHCIQNVRYDPKKYIRIFEILWLHRIRIFWMFVLFDAEFNYILKSLMKMPSHSIIFNSEKRGIEIKVAQ